MRHRIRTSPLLFLLFLLPLLSGATHAGEITRPSGVPELGALKKTFSLPEFSLAGEYVPGAPASFARGGTGGITLESLGQESLRTGYIAVGTPERNAEGKIVNAVLINSYYAGDAALMYYFWYEGQKGNAFCQGPVVGPGRLIDTDKTYVVFLDALGLWGASKPSDGLGMRFPAYSYQDMVQANYRLVTEKLGIARVKLVTGVSMGGAQSYVWAVLHPELVEAILPIGGYTFVNPAARWLFQLMSAAMQSDPVWQETKGDYYGLSKDKHPSRGLMFGMSVLAQSAMSLGLRSTQPWDEVKKEVFSWEPRGTEGEALLPFARDFDVNDLLCRNRAGEAFDIRQDLGKIKARALILHTRNDQWLPWAQAEETGSAIPGARVLGFEDPLSHYAIYRLPNLATREIREFLAGDRTE